MEKGKKKCTKQKDRTGATGTPRSPMKRKIESGPEEIGANGEPEAKKRALSTESAASRFRDGLLNRDVLEDYKQAYADSKP